MKFFHTLTIVSLFLFYSSAEAQHCKSKKALSAAEQLATLDPSFDLDLVDLDLFSGSSIVSGYEYEVEPAHTNGLYSRADSWQIGVRASTGRTLSERIRTTFNLGVRSKTEATFIRFFLDPCKAMLATPYSPRRIPLKTKSALSPKFRVGDYFLFRGSMGVVAGVDIFKMMGNLWAGSFSGNYLMEGTYQVHVVKIDESHIRLKVIAHRSKSFGASFGIGWEGEFNVFSIDRLNSRLERFVNTKPLKITSTNSHAKVFMVDYVLDLTDPEIAEAYEQLLPQAKNFKNLNLIKEFKKGFDSDLLLDLSTLEEIYRRDYENGRQDRLKRNLRSTSDQDAWDFGFSIGNKVLGFELKGGNSSANMSIPRPNDYLDRYLLKSWEKRSGSRVFYSWLKTKNNEGFRALFKADEEFKNFEPINIIKFINRQQNRFSYNNFKNLKLKLKKSLPKEIFDEIPWENWNQRKGKKFINYGLRYEFLMSPETILKAPELTVREIKTLFKDHILSKGLQASDYFTSTENLSTNEEQTPEEQFDLALHSMAKTLSKALKRSLPSDQRVNLISKLRRNTLFAESGMGFLMSFYPDKLSRYCHFDLNISSNEAQIDFSYGDNKLATLYKKILTIKAALDDDGIDLIREAESLSYILESDPNRIY